MIFSAKVNSFLHLRHYFPQCGIKTSIPQLLILFSYLFIYFLGGGGARGGGGGEGGARCVGVFSFHPKRACAAERIFTVEILSTKTEANPGRHSDKCPITKFVDTP